ncbi:hypothetical protein [Aurantiacibacter sediminis]|uniref:Uncharacterized protein n=1 Tax=Aurantiacibacter sediminis TaxID=2793064 RepID=A0ABS0MZR8_9SPHN|nr:hypothetical protein [Aurantiacibacter sediminis]MBH5321210.1 hypothetical protein [Aurantiacibacter sediminis]
MRRTLTACALGAALISCSPQNSTEAPEPPTPDEERAIAQATEMLGERTGDDEPAANAPDRPAP